MAQSISPVFWSIRKSRYQSFTDMTIVSVVSRAGSGSHRSEMRVEKRQDDPARASGLAMDARDVCCPDKITWWICVLDLRCDVNNVGELRVGATGSLKGLRVNGVKRYSRYTSSDSS